MIILGVDPSIRNCGYAILERTKKSTALKMYGCLKLPSRLTVPQRLHKIYIFFEDLITTHRVDKIALETPFYSRNANTFMKLSYVRGLLYLLSEEYDLSTSEYAPTEIKQAITGYGAADKEQVAAVLYSIFPTLEKVERDDVSDAIAVAVTSVWRN